MLREAGDTWTLDPLADPHRWQTRATRGSARRGGRGPASTSLRAWGS